MNLKKRLIWSQFLFALLPLSCKCNAGLLCLFLIRGWRANVSSILMLPACHLLPHPQPTFFLKIFLIWARCFSSVQFRYSVVSDSSWPHGLQHTRPPCPSPTPRVYSNSRPWVSDAIQPSHPLFSPSPPAFNLIQHQGFFKWVSSLHPVAKVLAFSASASVLPMNIQDWFPLGWTGWQGV